MVDMIDLHGLITSYLPRRLLYQRDLDHSDLTIVLQLQIAAPAGYRADDSVFGSGVRAWLLFSELSGRVAWHVCNTLLLAFAREERK
jgi:hypothetical protein